MTESRERSSHSRKASCRFKTDNIGTLSVEWIHVAELRSTNTFTIETRRGEIYFGTLAETEENRIVVVDDDVAIATLDIDSVVNIYRVKESFWSRLDGSLDIGYGYTQQNGSTQFNLNTSVYERREHRRIQVDYSSLFSTQDDADDTTRNSLAATFYRRFTGKWFYIGLGSVQQNNGLDLDLRTIVGGGFGRQLYQSNAALFSVFGGLDVNRELYTFNEEPVNSAEAIAGVEFSHFTYDGLTNQLTVQFIALPNLTQEGRIRFQLDVNLRQNIIGNLYWSIDLFETYDSEPPQPDAPKSEPMRVSNLPRSTVRI